MDNPIVLPKPRKKKLRKGQVAGPWITFRKTVQYLALIAFISLFVWSSQGGGAGNLINIPMRLDPLLMLANLAASRVFLAGSALALIIMLLTVVFGRAWCGWLCPLGTVLDIIPLSRGRGKRPAPPEGWRKVKFILVIVIFVAALLGNLTLLFFDPLALLLRTLTISLWPALDRIVTALEAALVNVPFLADPLATFDGWIRPAVLPIQPVFYQTGLLSAAVFLAVILLNLLAARFWCRYLCPLGGGLGWLSKLAIFRRRVDSGCKGCLLCTDICPTSTIDPAKDYASDPAECTMCLNCIEVCPRPDQFRTGIIAGEKGGIRSGPARSPAGDWCHGSHGGIIEERRAGQTPVALADPATRCARNQSGCSRFHQMHPLQRMCAGLSHRRVAAFGLRGRAGRAGRAHPGTAFGLLRLFLQRLRPDLPGPGHPSAGPGTETQDRYWAGIYRSEPLHPLVRSPALPGLRRDVPAAKKGHPI